MLCCIQARPSHSNIDSERSFVLSKQTAYSAQRTSITIMTTVSLLKVPQTNATFKKIGSIHSGRFVLHGPYYVLL